MAANKFVAALNDVGQSVWYDNVSREILNSGKLKGFFDAGVSGLTSNPTIFKKAIADSADYDKDIAALAKQGKNAEQICEELMVRDVGAAADLLRPTFDRTKGHDGHASIEVSPFLAADTKSTVSQAKELWKRLARPNIMIKVPATKEGLPAVQELLSEGINVNITLIFSKEVYEQVANAFITALENRAKKGLPVAGIASVASFFVSRVDAICEKRFGELVKAGKAKAGDLASFEGKVGIANSKVAYAAYEQLFSAGRFKALRDKGAQVQRPLWASTGTKNPAFSPVLYVEELAGRDTVNTMPPQTVDALLKGATIEPRLHRGLDSARAMIKHVEGLGIPVSQLLVDLQVEGVKLFADAYRELLDSVEAKRKKLA